MTLRDDVWDKVMTMLATEEEFRISELDFEDEQKYTIRRTLNHMEDTGWVERNSKQSSTWRTGWKMKLILGQGPAEEQDAEMEDKP